LENALDTNAEELTSANSKLQLFINNAPAGIAMFDNKMNYLFASRRWLEDRKINAYDVIGNNHYKLFPHTPEKLRQTHLRCLVGASESCDEDLIVVADDTETWIRWEILPWKNSKGQIGGIIILSENITKRKMAEAELHIASVAFQSRDPMLVTNANGVILKANEAFSLATGYSLEELIGNKPSLFKSEEHQDPVFYRNLWEAILSEGRWEGNIWNRRKDGAIYPIWLSISAIRNAKDEINHFLAIYSNIRDPREAERKILELAFYDPLTDLPNRRLLIDRLQQAHLQSVRSGKYGAVLMIDLDHFKTINDLYGHDVGDEILIDVSKCLRAALRDTDTAARLGGDEFVVLLTELGNDLQVASTSIKVVLDKLIHLLSKPKEINGITHNVTASIGVATFPNEEKDLHLLFKQADIALYQAKSSGRNTVSIFNTEMHEKFIERASLTDRLKSAVSNDEFIVHYQPQVNFNGQLKGAEALLRWQCPENGLIPPLSFIPLAEENGLIIPIGYWAIETVCKQLIEWRSNPLTAELCLSINISALQFRQTDFSNQLKQILLETGANPRLLTLELTESVLLNDLDHVINIMLDLRAIGVRFSIDDFGTGYSSLTYLKRLPLDEIKIDRSFVTDLMNDPGDRAIIRSILILAKSLNLKVTAEGIELPEQRDFLAQEGCDTFQGYLYGRPTAIDPFNIFINEFSSTNKAC
jgi:diguanylate cyclase (GGDEF)-like protein/PAS domain S-box-containing protein